MMSSLPHFKSIELLKKEPGGSISNIKYEDCSMMITANHLIVITEYVNSSTGSISTTGNVFNLSEIKAYKTK